MTQTLTTACVGLTVSSVPLQYTLAYSRVYFAFQLLFFYLKLDNVSPSLYFLFLFWPVADLIMLGLATHEPNFTIIREEFKPNKPKPCALCNQMGHEVKDCQGLPREKQGKVRILLVLEILFVYKLIYVLMRSSSCSHCWFWLKYDANYIIGIA